MRPSLVVAQLLTDRSIDSQSAPAAALAGAASACPTVRYLVTGTFNTALLYLLSYDTLTHRLSIARSIPAQGPHQYLALGRGPEQRPDRLYATTWAWPPSLSSWAVEGIQGADGEGPDLRWINTKNISECAFFVESKKEKRGWNPVRPRM